VREKDGTFGTVLRGLSLIYLRERRTLRRVATFLTEEESTLYAEVSPFLPKIPL